MPTTPNPNIFIKTLTQAQSIKFLQSDLEVYKTEVENALLAAGFDDLFYLNYEYIPPPESETINNPLQEFSETDACMLFLQESPCYIRFGALLNYIKNNIIIKIKNSKGKEPIFNIDTNLETQKMYSLPNRISLDPRVCIVRNSKIDIGSFKSKPSGSISETDDLNFESPNNDNTKAIAFDSLQPFTDEDNDGTNKNSAYILNIYLNFNFVLESLAADSKGNVSIYDLLSNICEGLNRALGGINNLEPIIDETSNILRIIDTTPIPKTPNEQDYALQIYGYNKLGNNYISNFVRKFDLKTAITPEFATMITVGATAGGYVKGVEATAFSKWNTGLTDRFKKEILPPKGEISSLDDDEATENYESAFRDHYRRYGITLFNSKFSNNLIEKNISVMTEYYKYLIATSTRNKDTSGGTVGFIPFKLTITMDGLSGIKIYNVLHINTEFLPIAYGRTVDLIVTGVSHNLSNNDWETSIETTAMPKTSSPFGKVSKSTSTRTTQTNSTIITENNVKKGSTTYGVVGFNTPNPILFPKALSKDTILNKMKDIFNKTFDETTPLNIRERIVMIALSYVGQIEKIDNRGYTDQNFQQRIHKSGWYDKAAWCGFFQKLVWQEAYTTGNLVVPAAPSNLQTLWKNKAKTIPSSVPGDEKKNSEKYKLWIPISGTPKPGDLVVMKSGHGEIFLKSIKNKNKITYYTIGGNSSNKVSFNTYIYPDLVRGFASVVTS